MNNQQAKNRAIVIAALDQDQDGQVTSAIAGFVTRRLQQMELSPWHGLGRISIKGLEGFTPSKNLCVEG